MHPHSQQKMSDCFKPHGLNKSSVKIRRARDCNKLMEEGIVWDIYRKRPGRAKLNVSDILPRKSRIVVKYSDGFPSHDQDQSHIDFWYNMTWRFHQWKRVEPSLLLHAFGDTIDGPRVCIYRPESAHFGVGEGQALSMEAIRPYWRLRELIRNSIGTECFQGFVCVFSLWGYSFGCQYQTVCIFH